MRKKGFKGFKEVGMHIRIFLQNSILLFRKITDPSAVRLGRRTMQMQIWMPFYIHASST
jgi:hypothetical protein